MSRCGPDHGGDHRRGPLFHLEVSLGSELLVRVGHHASRDAEVRREHARRGQPRPGDEPPVLYREPERVPQRAPHLAATKLDLERQPARPPAGLGWVAPLLGSTAGA